MEHETKAYLILSGTIRKVALAREESRHDR